MSPDLANRRYRLVIALDHSQYAEIVLEHALDLAARHDACDLHVLAVQEANAPLDEIKQRLVGIVSDGLDDFHGEDHDWHVRLHVRRGKPVEEIAGLAGEVQADIIVVGRFGTHRPFRRLGSVAEQVLAQAPCPTLVVQLVDQVVDARPPCPACVTVRHDSQGERWFCDAHGAPERVGMATTLLPVAGGWTGGGPMW